MDIRAFGKGYEEYYKRAQLGIRFIRGRVAEIRETRDEGLIVRIENTLSQEVIELPSDLVVSSAATEPSDGTGEIIEVLGIGKDESGFIKEFHPKLRPCDTTIEGIFVAGCAPGPKDIQDSIAMASGQHPVLNPIFQ
jgi:heterodisulfide reductase subunit A